MEINCKNNWNKVTEVIESNLNIESKNILIQSGHFSLLFNKKGKLIPAILEEIDDEKLKEFIADSNYMNDFPTRTFNTGVEFAYKLKLKSKNIKFSFIVNDWQWVNKGLYNFYTNRFNFYKDNSLPKSYENLLKKFHFDTSDVIKVNHYVENNIFYSEHKLRKQGKKTMSECSPESCAIEYLPFLEDTLIDSDTLISFIPMSCKTPVLYAAIRFVKEKTSKIDLFHIFYNPMNKELELSFLNRANLNIEYENEVNDNHIRMGLMSK